jgi:hypothetical protein
MKWTKWLCAVLFALVVVQSALAREGSKPYQINNRLRVEYDDNINQTENNKDNSWKIIEELEFLVNFSLQNTYVGVRYRPSYIWWDNRPSGGSSDFQNELDFILNQTFSPRLNLSVVDTLRRGESPKTITASNGVPEDVNGDFYYNTLNATLGYLLRPTTRLEMAGRYVTQRYDDEVYSDSDNFDLYVGGLTLRHQLVPETTLIGEFRGESVEYDGPDRGSKSLYAGGGVEQIFSPNLIGSVVGGYQKKDFNENSIGSESTPYVDASATFLPSPATRISAGAGYSMFETEVFPFASQDRAQMFASIAHDFTARLSLYLSGSYIIGSYSADQALPEPDPANPSVTAKGGDEDTAMFSTRLTYQLNRSNWLEAGWQYVNFDSTLEYSNDVKLRENFAENRVDVGWKTQF